MREVRRVLLLLLLLLPVLHTQWVSFLCGCTQHTSPKTRAGFAINEITGLFMLKLLSAKARKQRVEIFRKYVLAIVIKDGVAFYC